MLYNITFVLPGHSSTPVGGFKVVYEYANRLVELGHNVVVVNACVIDKNKEDRNIRKMLIYILRKIGLLGGYRPTKWLFVNPKVEILWRYSLEGGNVPNADIVIATFWKTAEWLKDYAAEKGKKYYLIHDYEHYMSANEAIKRRIACTYNMGYSNIVTSPAGIELLKICEAPIKAKISNGIDFDIYKLLNKIDSVQRNMIGFPARTEHFKGTKDIVQALFNIKDKVKDSFKIWAFGPVKISGLPPWVDFYLCPDNNTIVEMLNKTAIFVLPSHYEGWGLPGAEAMACGAALVTTDNMGIRDYATDKNNSLFAQKENPDSLAEKVMELINNQELRLRIAKEGNKNIQSYTWEKATKEMVDVFITDNI